MFETSHYACDLCESEHPGLFYCCSLCDVRIHGKCASLPPPIVEDKIYHEHPFTLLLRPHAFTCDACGTYGKNVSYICSTCNIQVHKDCVSNPRFIRINLHRHPLSHIFSLCINDYHDSQAFECKICYKEGNLEYGSYYCHRHDCDFFVHVKCAMQNKSLYGVIEVENREDFKIEVENLDDVTRFDLLSDPIFSVVKEAKVGGDVIAVMIKHAGHQHNLTFSDETKDYGRHCNACVLPILPPFYYCSECDFFLHKACAMLPKKTRLWTSRHPFILHTHGPFQCDMCEHDCSGFYYKLDTNSDVVRCLRCATIPHSFTYKAQEPHHLFFDNKYEGHCSACGNDKNVIYKCKDCDFALDMVCLTLPRTTWQKCDEHSLTLAYQDNSDYLHRYYCDICEERRDPKYWFYHCKDCNTAVHPKCVIEKYPFIKPGSVFRHRGWKRSHQHPLTFVQKMHYYPQCNKCRGPCQDLSLEGEDRGRNYIVHWKCIKTSPFY